MPKVSIILPCYNVEKYIAKSIESVLSQTFQNFELLIINDGTPDNSMEIARGYKDPRIKIFDKENGGLSDARNYGIERAQGEYIYFMDSDDWIEPDLLEITLAALEEKQLDLVIFGYFQDDEDLDCNLISSKEIAPSKTVYHKNEQGLYLDYHLVGILGYAWNKVYRRSFLSKHDLIFEKGTSLVEDVLFNSQVYSKTDTLYFIESSHYHYMNRPEKSLMKQFHENSFELKVKKNQFLEMFFSNWNIINSKDLLSKILFGGIKNTTHNLYFYNNKLNKKEQNSIIKEMFFHDRTKMLLPYYNPENMKDLFLKLCVKYKMISLFHFVMKNNKK